MSLRPALLAFAAVGAVASLVTVGTPSASAAHVDEVIAVEHKANGHTHVRIYRPAQGVSAETLRDRLRASGVRNAEVAAHSDIGPAALPCSYGSARSIQCPPVRWAHNGHSDPQVYFLDHTGAGWPMTTVVPTWHQAVGIDSYYRWHTNGCSGNGAHCPHAYSGNYGATGWAGLMEYSYDGNDYFVDGTVTMKLNDYYAGSATLRRNTACHEAGHVLGLGHNTSTGSCLYYQQGSAQNPNGDDFSLLPRLYP